MGPQDLIDSFQPHGSIEWRFGGGSDSGTIHFKAGATDAEEDFDLLAVNSFGNDVTGSLTPEERQRAFEAIRASSSNRS